MWALRGVAAAIDRAKATRFYCPTMKRLTALLGMILLACTGYCAEQARLLQKADPLPLALDDAFEFRKSKLFFNEPNDYKPTVEQMITFERMRANYGAITADDRDKRKGNYFTFFWRSKREANLKVRLEYRQERLGDFVQAQEVEVPNAHGSHVTEFQVTGDDYRNDGRVTAWRALLIENGRIVGLTQSYLWN